MTMAAASHALVIGLGHPDRGDDAVGTIVAERLSDGRLPASPSWRWAKPPTFST